jgi:hypothetical protein
VHADDLDPFLPRLLDRCNVPPQLVDFVLDVRVDVFGSQVRENLFNQSSRDRQSLLKSQDVEGDVEFIEFSLQC